MPRLVRALLTGGVLLGSLLSGASPDTGVSAGSPAPVPLTAGALASDRVLVQFSPDRTGVAALRRTAVHGAWALRELNGGPIHVLRVPPGEAVTVAAQLAGQPGVLFARPDALATIQETIPDDPDYANQYGPALIEAPQAWDLEKGNASVIIAIIDTGVSLTHPDLVDKIWHNPGETGMDGGGQDRRSNGLDDDGNGYVDDWRGWNFVNQSNNPQDDHSHGTHVAGVAAAATDNGLGVAGISWGARIMALKALDSQGNGTYSDIADAVTYAVENGARIVNLSLGGNCPPEPEPLHQAIDNAVSQGTLVVAAAGNGNGPVICPAAWPNSLAVIATDSDNQRASFSNSGPEVDVAAPGVSIYSTSFDPVQDRDTYAYLSGTSQATPHVAGVAALLASLPRFDSPAKLRQAMEATALDLGASGWDRYYGHGLVQAHAALNIEPTCADTPPSPDCFAAFLPFISVNGILPP